MAAPRVRAARSRRLEEEVVDVAAGLSLDADMLQGLIPRRIELTDGMHPSVVEEETLVSEPGEQGGDPPYGSRVVGAPPPPRGAWAGSRAGSRAPRATHAPHALRRRS